MDLIDYFRVTNKGITPIDSLSDNSYLTKSFFGMSLGMEIIYMLIFITLFALAIYRSVKKIKNPKFKPHSEQQEQQQASKIDPENDAKQTNDNLIYRFDEEDHEKEKKGEGEEEEANSEKMDEDSEGEYEKEHDQNQDRFLEIDEAVTFFHPFLIGNVICVSLFSSDFISIIAILASVILFLIFNIRGVCQNVKILSMIFMVPSLLSFLPVFISDHDMST